MMRTPQSARPRLLTRLLLGTVLAVAMSTVVPVPGLAQGPPRTLAWRGAVGTFDGVAAVDPNIPVEYLGVSWTSGDEPSVRFRGGDGAWTGWKVAHEDELQQPGRTYSRLLPAADADRVQIRGDARGVRVVAINTSDGPRGLGWGTATASASHLSQPGVVSRAAWGADEGYRFNPDGSEKWPPAFFETRKLIVHHTATRNDDPDPAATVRAIYYYHAIERGFGDIGYNFLVDARGTIYKGRYSGPAGTRDQDTQTGENGLARGVTAAHTGGWNSGTMGIAVLGTYTDAAVPAAARQAVVDHLAWESERHGIDPTASSTFTNPVSGAEKTTANISGHQDWVATECPGGTFYADLPAIREDVATKVDGTGSDPSPSPEPSPEPETYAPTSVSVAKGRAVGDPVEHLAEDDQARYRVRSQRVGKRYLTNWWGSATIDATDATRITVTYDGSASRAVSQKLYIRDVAAGTWALIWSGKVSTNDETVTWSTGDPARYVGGSGEIRLRVRSTKRASHTMRGDLMRFVVEY